MPWPRTNAYAQWRAQNEARAFLLERQVTDPPERLLQAIWRYQRLRRDGLQTLDGRPVRVLHPGFWNREAGPDFRGAVVQFGADPPQTGDVEVDFSGSLWRLHQHDANPAYTGVILHVIWSGQPAGVAALPTLALESMLDSPVNHLKVWLGSGVSKELPAGQVRSDGGLGKPIDCGLGSFSQGRWSRLRLWRDEHFHFHVRSNGCFLESPADVAARGTPGVGHGGSSSARWRAVHRDLAGGIDTRV